MSKIPIVDKGDNIIGEKERTLITPTDFYRVSALWITNSKGQILLQRRAKTKRHHPNTWAAPVCGTIEINETYEENIHKELEEELGITNQNLKKSIKEFRQEQWNYFAQWYTLVTDLRESAFTIDKRETEEVKWWDKQELLTAIENKTDLFIDHLEKDIKRFS